MRPPIFALVGLTLFLTASPPVGVTSAMASGQTKLDEAEALRKAAERKAERQIGRPDAVDLIIGDSNREVDYYALSRQISRLAAFIRAFGQTLDTSTSAGLGIVGGAEPPSGDTRAVYGPDGPTAKTVRVILEYRLMVTGNPRLSVGQITEDAEMVTAEVVTTGATVVEVYSINKKTGVWRPVR